MPASTDHLTHLVYEASLDNSLWPELVLELTEQLQRAGRGDLIGRDGSTDIAHLAEHFRRAFEIWQKMVGLQEREPHLEAVLNTFSFGLALLDDAGRVMLQNRAMQDVLAAIAPPGGALTLAARRPDGEDAPPRPILCWDEACNRIEAPHALYAKGASRIANS